MVTGMNNHYNLYKRQQIYIKTVYYLQYITFRQSKHFATGIFSAQQKTVGRHIKIAF